MALRVAPALAAAATVLLVGLIARDIGGDRRAQFLAAAAAAGSVPVLATGHILATASLDVFFAAALAFVLARLVRTGNERLWAAAGLVLGVGLLNRVFLALYVVVLLGAVVAAGPRAPLVAVNSELGEQIGWPEMGRTVAGVVERLPDGQRARTWPCPGRSCGRRSGVSGRARGDTTNRACCGRESFERAATHERSWLVLSCSAAGDLMDAIDTEESDSLVRIVDRHISENAEVGAVRFRHVLLTSYTSGS